MVVIMDFNEYQKLAIKSALYKNIDVVLLPIFAMYKTGLFGDAVIP